VQVSAQPLQPPSLLLLLHTAAPSNFGLPPPPVVLCAGERPAAAAAAGTALGSCLSLSMTPGLLLLLQLLQTTPPRSLPPLPALLLSDLQQLQPPPSAPALQNRPLNSCRDQYCCCCCCCCKDPTLTPCTHRRCCVQASALLPQLLQPPLAAPASACQ
jgi:hypothetical protein